MKQVITIPALALSFTPTTDLRVYYHSNERIEAELTHDLKYTDLEKIKKALLEKGIQIEYLSLEFGYNKNLSRIKFAVAC